MWGLRQHIQSQCGPAYVWLGFWPPEQWDNKLLLFLAIHVWFHYGNPRKPILVESVYLMIKTDTISLQCFYFCLLWYISFDFRLAILYLQNDVSKVSALCVCVLRKARSRENFSYGKPAAWFYNRAQPSIALGTTLLALALTPPHPVTRQQLLQGHSWSCSITGRCQSGPLPQATTVKEWPWWCSLTNSQQNGGPQAKWWSSVQSEVSGGSRPSPQGPSSSPSFWPLESRGAQGTGWGSVLQGSRVFAKAAHWPDWGLKAGVNLSLPPQPKGSGRLPGSRLRGQPHHLGSLRSLRANCFLGAWLPQQWQLGRFWGLGPKKATSWGLPLQSGPGPWRGESWALGTFLSLSE